jgi:hypothetical protein
MATTTRDVVVLCLYCAGSLCFLAGSVLSLVARMSR